MRAIIYLALIGLVFLAGCVNGNNSERIQEPVDKEEGYEASPMGEEMPSSPLSPGNSLSNERKVVCTVEIEDDKGNKAVSTSYIKGESLRVDSEGFNGGGKQSVIIRKEGDKYVTYLGKSMISGGEKEISCDWMIQDSYDTTEYGGVSVEDYKQYIGDKVTVEKGGYRYSYKCEYRDFPDDYLNPSGKTCTFDEIMREAYGVSIEEN